MLTDPWFWVLGLCAVTLLGLAKGGFVGVANVSMPLFALAVPPLQAAAILLPILIAQDAIGLYFFRKSWDPHALKVLLPGACFGILLGYLFSALLSERWVEGALGTISILFALQRLWMERGGRSVAAHRLPDWVGTLCGAVSGLTSQISHAGAPPYQVWILPQKMPRDVLVGTTTIYFATINWVKVPAYLALGQISSASLQATAALMPAAFLATVVGVRLVRRVSAERFYTIIYLLMLMVGLTLIYKAAS